MAWLSDISVPIFINVITTKTGGDMYFISDYREELFERYGKGNYRVTTKGGIFIRDRLSMTKKAWCYIGEINEPKTLLFLFGESDEPYCEK